MSSPEEMNKQEEMNSQEAIKCLEYELFLINNKKRKEALKFAINVLKENKNNKGSVQEIKREVS